MANNHETLTGLFSNIADVIRNKTDSTGTIVADNFPAEIDKIVTLKEGSADATATANQILSGQTAYVNGSKVTGTISMNGSVSKTLNAGESTTVRKGYYYADSTITAKDLASQTEADATADDVADGKTAWVNGSKVTGTGEMASDLAPELSTQDDLIAELTAALAGKALPDGSEPAEDLSSELAEQSNIIAEQDELITQLASALEGKVGASGAPEPISITADNIEQYFIVDPSAGDVAFDWSNNQFSAQDVDGAILIISFTALQNVDLSLRLTISPEVVGGELFITHNNNNVFNAPNPMATAELSCDASFNFNLSANDVLLIDTIPVGSVVISNLSVIPK